MQYRISSLLGLSAGILLSACGASDSLQSETSPAWELAQCQSFLEKQELPPLSVEEPAPALSRLHFSAQLPEVELVQWVEKQIPPRLAQAKNQPVGAPGQATYRVDRGRPQISADGKNLRLTLPVQANIEVCKPLGTVCLRYGQCEPSFEVEFTQSLDLGSSYKWPTPRGRVQAKKRCVIGLDVTSQITKLAEAEVKKIEKQIQKQLPPLEPLVRELLSNTLAPLPEQGSACLHMDAEKVNFSAPRKQGEQFLLGWGVEGHLARQESCSPGKEKKKLPPLQLKSVEKEEVALWVETELLFSQWEQEINQALRGRPEERLRIMQVRVHPASSGVLFELEVRGSLCGSVWVEAAPQFHKETAKIQFSRFQVKSQLPEETTRALEAYLAEKAQISAQPALTRKKRVEEELSQRLERELKNTPGIVGKRLEDPALVGKVLPTQRGILLRLPVSSQIDVQVEPGALAKIQ